jgi:hypothetical protein
MKYIVNKNAQANGDHEVHKWPESLCSSPRYPMSENQLHLGEYDGCTGAVQEAKKRGYPTANGCYYCSSACNTG